MPAIVADTLISEFFVLGGEIDADREDPRVQRTMNELLYESGVLNRAYIKVDLNCSDDSILAAMKEWLAKSRKRYLQPNSNKTVTVLEKALRHRAVPYIDLRIWQLVVDKNIPDEMMIDVLFPGTDSGKNKLKATKHWAHKSLSNAFLAP